MNEIERKKLVERLKIEGSIKSKAVEEAFLNVKRELFMPNEFIQYSYVDSAFPIGFGQTISQPTTIAITLEMLSVEPNNKCLEIGSGCGYVLALLAQLTKRKSNVFGVELIKELFELSKKNLLLSGNEQIRVFYGDGSNGLPEFKPFDRILLSCAAKEIPEPLIEQLNENGIIVAPLGSKFTQELVAFKKEKNELKEIERKGYFVFVSLRGKYGFKPL